ncbi:SDR family oxidoreductase [Paucibacter sp. R3-3]|uniref:SDR family oxidoreductase n=1 Tax=Roseateles agri TaxID=3098619 RepID=A0ABU5DDP8_9BURK|nr:SDR family oxidoreductase [Paucibacter sp. R3-3]MDY0744400.1 SDR family oxidoreductase [Paucibacter sp. R3-3]
MTQILIIGASRGIGLELVRQYRADGAQVVATARSDEGLAALRELGATALKLDVADTASASGLAWQIDGRQFDTVFIVAGVYGPRHTGLQSPTASEFDDVMHTNVLGPMRVLPQLPDYLAPGAKLAIISSRMGSIGERTSAAGWLYRASKAAANSVLKDASLLLAGKATCLSFHPGWVRTDMGGSGADIDVADSVSGMRRALAAAEPEDNGSFRNYDGQPISW